MTEPMTDLVGAAAQAVRAGAAGRGRAQPPARAPRGGDRVAEGARGAHGGLHDGHAPQPAGLRGARAWSRTTCAVPVDGGAAPTRSTSCSCCCGASSAARARSRCTATATPTSSPRCAPPTCTSTAGIEPRRRACAPRAAAGLMVTPEACALLGVDYAALRPRAHELGEVGGHLHGLRAVRAGRPAISPPAEHQRAVEAGGVGGRDVGVQAVAHHQRAAVAEAVERRLEQSCGRGLAHDLGRRGPRRSRPPPGSRRCRARARPASGSVGSRPVASSVAPRAHRQRASRRSA